MNIKLDNDVRIRLDENDTNAWKKNKHLFQTFSVGNLSIEIEFLSEVSATNSFFEAGEKKILIVLNQEDSKKLESTDFPKNGINLNEINIQIDQWSPEKRKRHDREN